MALNYTGSEKIGELGVWSFTDETGQPFRTDDPMLALQLGAPVGSESPAPAPGMPAPGAPPPPGSPGAPPPPPPPMPDPGPAPAPAPGTGLPPGPPPPQAFMGDPGQFGLGAPPASPDMRTAMAMAPDDTGIVTDVAAPLDPYVPPPAVPAPADDPNLDFGDGANGAASPGPGPGAQQQQGPQGDMETYQALVPGAPQRYRRSAASPGGWMDTQRSFKGDPDTANRLAGEQRQLADQAMQNAVTRMELDESSMKAEQTNLLHSAMKQEVEMAEQRSVIAQQEEYKRTKQEAIAARNKEIAEMKVNPKELFQDDPGGLFLAALFTGMGQFGASINGGPNYAGDMIQSYIKNNISEQQRQIDEARLENEKADNALQRLLDEGADPRFAKAQLELMQQTYATTVLQSNQVQQQAKYLGVDTADTITAIGERAVANEVALMQAIGAEAQQKFRQPTSGGISEDPNYLDKYQKWLNISQQAGEMTGVMDPKEVRVERAKQAAASGGPDKALFWKGSPVGSARTEGEGKELRKKLTALGELDDVLTEMNRLAEDWNSLSPADKAASATLAAKAQLLIKDVEGMGAIQAPDVPFIEALAQDPNRIGTLDSERRARFGVMKGNIIRSRNSVLTGQGNTDPQVLQMP